MIFYFLEHGVTVVIETLSSKRSAIEQQSLVDVCVEKIVQTCKSSGFGQKLAKNRSRSITQSVLMISSLDSVTDLFFNIICCIEK